MSVHFSDTTSTAVTFLSVTNRVVTAHPVIQEHSGYCESCKRDNEPIYRVLEAGDAFYVIQTGDHVRLSSEGNMLSGLVGEMKWLLGLCQRCRTKRQVNLSIA